MTQDDVDEALALYARGWSLEDIGDRFNVSRQRVYQVLRQSNRFTSRRPSGRPPMVDADRVAAMYRAGWTPAAIAGYFERSPATIYRALTRAGVELRPR